MFTKSMATTLTFVSLFASTALAQESQTSTMTTPKASMNVNDPVGWFPFIGLSGGYMGPTDQRLTESNNGDIKIIGSFFSPTRRSVLDIGAGVAGNSFVDKSTTMSNYLNNGIAELAWRYNSPDRWQVGPVVNTLVGTNSGTRFGSTDPDLTTFAGLQIVKEFPVRGASMFRVGLKGLTDVSVPDADVTTVMLDLQWGFGRTNESPIARNEATEESDADAYSHMTSASQTTGTTEAVNEAGSMPDADMVIPSEGSDESARADIPSDVEAAGDATGATYGVNSRRVIETDPSNNAMLIRNDARLQFTSGSAILEGDNAEFVASLGSALAERSDLFDRVEVIGYADQTGSRQVNEKVSRSRSEIVADSLEEGGLDRNKMEITWKGSSEPLYQSMLPEDLQQNRRVDLKFYGVKDHAALEQLLSNL